MIYMNETISCGNELQVMKTFLVVATNIPSVSCCDRNLGIMKRLLVVTEI